MPLCDRASGTSGGPGCRVDEGECCLQEEWSTRFETDFGETAAEASTAAADHGKAPAPTLSLQDIDAAIDKEMASPQVLVQTLWGQHVTQGKASCLSWGNVQPSIGRTAPTIALGWPCRNQADPKAAKHQAQALLSRP